MILLDANVLVWWMQGSNQLGPKTTKILADDAAELTVSLLTLFELELKAALGKIRFDKPLSQFLTLYGIPVYSPQADELPKLLTVPLKHGDPFDKSIIGLADYKGWDLLTSDGLLHAVPLSRSLVIDSRL